MIGSSGIHERTAWHRPLQAAVLARVCAVLVAGCAVDEPTPLDGGEPIEADVYLHNDTAAEVVVHVSTLAASVDVDCDAVAGDPAGFLTDETFAAPRVWTMPSKANVGLWDEVRDRDCYAVRLDAADVDPVVVFWRDGEPPVRTIEGSTLPGELHGQGAVVMVETAAGSRRIDDLGTGLVHPVPSGQAEPPTAACAPLPDGDRLAFDEPVPTGVYEIAEVESGIDGCLALELHAGAEEVLRWYLCVPDVMFPFDRGDTIEIDHVVDVAAGYEGVALFREGTSKSDSITLTAARGASLPDIDGVSLKTAAKDACQPWADPDCGTVGIRATVRAAGPDAAVDIDSGALIAGLATESGSLDVLVLHAHERPVVNALCSQGADLVGPDVEAVTVHRHRGTR